MGCLIAVLVCCLIVFALPLLYLFLGAAAVLLELALYIAPIALVVLVVVWIFDMLTGN